MEYWTIIDCICGSTTGGLGLLGLYIFYVSFLRDKKKYQFTLFKSLICQTFCNIHCKKLRIRFLDYSFNILVC